MLRELCCALSGYYGEVFYWNDKTNTVEVANELPFLQPSETSLLQKLCKLASFYIKFQAFVEKNMSNSESGIYLKAFSRSLDAYLQTYQKSIMSLENEICNDEFVGLSYVQTHTEKFQVVFPVISGMIDDILNNELTGFMIIDVLYKASRTGLVEVKQVIMKMLQMCLVVFYKHLSLWMLHGKLPENFHNKNSERKNEFIITRYKSTIETGDNSQSLQSDVSGYAIYEVNLNQVPSFISLSLAEKILFIGQSVVLFESGKVESALKNDDAECLIPLDKQVEFKKQLSLLCDSDDFHDFELTLQNIRNFVAQQLYTLIVEKCDLQSQLKNFKDFFLIGRGELFLAFIDQTQNLLNNPPSNTTQYDVNLAFEHACRDLMINENIRKPFSLIICDEKVSNVPAAETIFCKGKKNGWSCLQMTASVEWPLHVLFTRAIINKYNSLFSFLLLVKRIQQQLQHCWLLQRNSSNSPSNATKWRLRNHMAFFIDNLQYYLQVDVIDSQYSVLSQKLSQHRDFEEVVLNHHNLLDSIMQQSFMHSKQIFSCITSILDLCQAYHGLSVYFGDGDDDLGTNKEGGGDNTLQRRLEEIEKAFQKQSTILFTTLSSKARCSNHLSLLLLRIDFNRYFSSISF